MPVSDESRITVICNPSHRLLTHPSHGLLLAARHRVMSPRLGPSIDSVYRVCIECVSTLVWTLETWISPKQSISPPVDLASVWGPSQRRLPKPAGSRE